ncbi:MAG: 2-amino-4-hydroxy-6-hydroxymethyldihydropteridine diphosphokinase [Endomicrobium sp.]|nr:2-amino-4-hydroxy-6-hydroxymethyldihydropteridine diphosphokinase [Endomicrobium sp.]
MKYKNNSSSYSHNKKTIYLSLGSNIGKRAENIICALSFLQSSLFVNIKKVSSFYETSPIGPKQRNFYNIAVKAETELNPEALLLLIKQAEDIFGCKKEIKWGPRIIDIDILFFCKEIVNCGSLIIPHKEIQNRLFVLVPLNEISRNFTHPVLERKINDILSDKLLTLRHQKVKIIRILF